MYSWKTEYRAELDLLRKRISYSERQIKEATIQGELWAVKEYEKVIADNKQRVKDIEDILETIS